MPKETVIFPRHYPEQLTAESVPEPTDPADLDNIPTLENDPEVERVVQELGPEIAIHWVREQHVQMSFEGSTAYFSFAANNPNGAQSGRSSVFTDPLTRDDINRTIKMLRRARDAAFGRDE